MLQGYWLESLAKGDFRDRWRALLLLFIGHFVQNMRILKTIFGKSAPRLKPYTFNGHIDMNATFPESSLLLLSRNDLWRFIFGLLFVCIWLPSRIIDCVGHPSNQCVPCYMYMSPLA